MATGKYRSLPLLLGALALLLLAAGPAAAIDPRFELDPKELAKKGEPAERVQKEPAGRKRGAAPAGYREYRVKPGDTLRRILQRESGLREGRVDALLPELRGVNRLTAGQRLQPGEILLIPRQESGAEQQLGTKKRRQKTGSVGSAPAPIKVMNLAVERREADAESLRQVWQRLLPQQERGVESVSLATRNFSLALDAERYPVLAAADGGKILLDSNNTLPPLVRSLITEQQPKTRIVSANPADRRYFYSALLGAAKFFSVAENAAVDFGSDPKLTVRADFKIERTQESLMRHELVLLNVAANRRPMPAALLGYMAREGFQVLEPYALAGDSRPVAGRHLVSQITTVKPQEIADALLTNLALPYSRDLGIDLFEAGDGVNLQVRADRYFEMNGRRYVMTLFDGDPIAYTLVRLLETRGYTVITLNENDSFKNVAEKLISRLRIPGWYSRHELTGRDLPYSLQISGIMLADPADREKRLFLTDRLLEPLHRELLDYSGYQVSNN